MPKKESSDKSWPQKKSSVRVPGSIGVDVKVGILHTIADAIYANPAGKIREAVANARDNDASGIAILIDQTRKAICLYDNGPGITKERFREIFKSIGYGMLKHQKRKLSYFGLGLMSIFKLGQKVKIYTRAKGDKKIILLKVDTQAIFDEKNEDKSISWLNECVSLSESNEAERDNNSPTLLKKLMTTPPFGSDPGSFTEILIEDVKKDDIATICTDEFVEELRKTLPLRVQDNEPFLQRFTGRKIKEIRKILLDNKDFCNTIEVFFGIQEEDTFKPLWKYFPAFRSNIEFPDDNVKVGVQKDFAYYIVHSVAVDLHGSGSVEKENGFWVRNNNFLVKTADFLEKPGPGRKRQLVDQPIKQWIFGEVFHKDMNSFLAVSRNEYLFEEEKFKIFWDELQSIIGPLNQELRDIWEKRKYIVEGLVEPFSKLAEPDGAIKKTEGKLRELVQQDLDEKRFHELIFDHLRKVRNKQIEDPKTRIDRILSQKQRSITLGEDENAVVKIAPELRDKGEDYQVMWDARNKKVVVLISPSLFEPKELVFLGETFTVYFVAKCEEDPGVSIDVDGKSIFINPFNEDMVQYSISIFDVYIVLQVADAISATKKELKANVLALLGARSQITQKYVTPLGDDLRRTVGFASPGV